MAELIDQPLATLRLLHDPFLVILPDATAQLVVVHGRPILSFAPQPGHADRVLDLEHTLATVQPAYTRAVDARALKQLLQELPEVDVRAAVTHFTTTAPASADSSLRRAAILVLIWKKRNQPIRLRFVSGPQSPVVALREGGSQSGGSVLYMEKIGCLDSVLCYVCVCVCVS